MRLARFDIMRQADGSRLAVYIVAIARRQFTVTRPLGSARVRIQRGRLAAVQAAVQRARPNPHTRRRRGFGPV